MAITVLPYIPASITVHLGPPDSPAENVTVPFPDYIKNVASSEVYPTWQPSALRANILAQVSFALNRVYTEYYRSRGYSFDITNTTAEATLENTQLKQAGDILVKVTSDRWGAEGKNGGDFTLNAQNQQLKGQILANNISKVALNLGENSSFQGTINSDNQAESAKVSLSKGASWQLTADAYVTSITDEASDFSNINSNKHNIYYDKNSNPGLNGKTIHLPGGGKLQPMR